MFRVLLLVGSENIRCNLFSPLQGARGNDGNTGPAGPPVSTEFCIVHFKFIRDYNLDLSTKCFSKRFIP